MQFGVGVRSDEDIDLREKYGQEQGSLRVRLHR
jgi:hypothetical protein